MTLSKMRGLGFDITDKNISNQKALMINMEYATKNTSRLEFKSFLKKKGIHLNKDSVYFRNENYSVRSIYSKSSILLKHFISSYYQGLRVKGIMSKFERDSKGQGYKV